MQTDSTDLEVTPPELVQAVFDKPPIVVAAALQGLLQDVKSRRGLVAYAAAERAYATLAQQAESLAIAPVMARSFRHVLRGRALPFLVADHYTQTLFLGGALLMLDDAAANDIRLLYQGVQSIASHLGLTYGPVFQPADKQHPWGSSRKIQTWEDFQEHASINAAAFEVFFAELNMATRSHREDVASCIFEAAALAPADTPKEGELYEHYKGAVYRIVGTATISSDDSTDGDTSVYYRSLGDTAGNGVDLQTCYSTTLTRFRGTVSTPGGPVARFRRLLLGNAVAMRPPR